MENPMIQTLLFKGMIYTYLKRAVHLHLMRTIWATEHITKTNDIVTAAQMLNDNVETVIQHYSHQFDVDAVREADQFLAKVLHS